MFVPFPFFNIYAAFAVILVIHSILLKKRLNDFSSGFRLYCINFQTEKRYSMLEIMSYVNFMTDGTKGDTDIFMDEGEAYLWRKSDGHSELITKEHIESYLKYLEDSHNSKIEDNLYDGEVYYKMLELERRLEDMRDRLE